MHHLRRGARGLSVRGMDEALALLPADCLAVGLDSKYDGQRAQVHAWIPTGASEWRVELFSRHLERMTDKYPDVVAALPRSFGTGTTSVVLDAEIVAVAPSGSGAVSEIRFLPMQTLSTRGRKAVAVGDITVPVCLCAFDLMLLNGRSLLERPYLERRALLAAVVQPQAPHVILTALEVMLAEESNLDSMRTVLAQALATPSCEGLMVKPVGVPRDHPLLAACLAARDSDEPGNATTTLPTLAIQWASVMRGGPAAVPLALGSPADAGVIALERELERWAASTGSATATTAATAMPAAGATTAIARGTTATTGSTYEPALRSNSWLKVKKDYVQGLVDSLDLVPIAAWWGNGRKTGWLSPFLMACYSPATEEWEAVCKCMTVSLFFFWRQYESRAQHREPARDKGRRRPATHRSVCCKVAAAAVALAAYVRSCRASAA